MYHYILLIKTAQEKFLDVPEGRPLVRQETVDPMQSSFVDPFELYALSTTCLQAHKQGSIYAVSLIHPDARK